MDKLNKLEIIIRATAVSRNEYESKSTYTLNDMDVSLTKIQDNVFVSVAALMDNIDACREITQCEPDDEQ